MLDCNMFPGLGRKYLESEVNLFLLPPQDSEGDDGLTKAGGLPCCSGLPSNTSLPEELVERATVQMSLSAQSGDERLENVRLNLVMRERVCVCVCPSVLQCPGSGSSPLFSLLPGYRGQPTFSSVVSKLRSQILAMPRCQLSHTILTEKNWYLTHYLTS